jgi:hypothetical protein
MSNRFKNVTSMSTTCVTTWDSLKAENRDIVAVVSGKECYDVMYDELSDVGKDVDRIYEQGFIEVVFKGEKVEMPADVIVCSDYKFQLMLLGLKGANSAHPCVWCRKKKDADTCSFQHLDGRGERRTLAFILEQTTGPGPRKQCGCDNPPLFRRIPICNYFLGMFLSFSPLLPFPSLSRASAPASLDNTACMHCFEGTRLGHSIAHTPTRTCIHRSVAL